MSSLRKDKEREFYTQHMDAFKAIGIADPFFTIKTAFFKKGKYGRQCQFFEWELKKEEDIYIEFYDNLYVNNIKDMVPMNEDRQLFKLKYNSYYEEEYDIIEGTDYQGNPDKKFLVPVNEMSVVLKSGQEISYSLYEKRKEDAKLEIPELQKSTTLFPNFEEDFAPKKEDTEVKEDQSLNQVLERIAVSLEKIESKLNNK